MSAQASTTLDLTLKVPSYFPTYKNECEKQALEFYDCFTREGTKTQKGDTQIGMIGLAKCKEFLGKYEACQEKYMKK